MAKAKRKSNFKNLKKGALRKQTGTPKGKKIPRKTLLRLAKKKGKTGKRARLALAFRKMNRKRRK